MGVETKQRGFVRNNRVYAAGNGVLLGVIMGFSPEIARFPALFSQYADLLAIGAVTTIGITISGFVVAHLNGQIEKELASFSQK